MQLTATPSSDCAYRNRGNHAKPKFWVNEDFSDFISLKKLWAFRSLNYYKFCTKKKEVKLPGFVPP